MDVILRYFEPKAEKEKLFRAQAMIDNELSNPVQAYVVLDGKEYAIEIYLDNQLTLRI